MYRITTGESEVVRTEWETGTDGMKGSLGKDGLSGLHGLRSLRGLDLSLYYDHLHVTTKGFTAWMIHIENVPDRTLDTFWLIPGTGQLVLTSGGCPRPYLGQTLCESYNPGITTESRNRGTRAESAVGTQKVPFSTDFSVPCSTERRAGVVCVKGPTSSRQVCTAVRQSGDGCRSDYTSRPEAWSDPRSSTGWRDPVLGPVETHWPGDGPGTTDWRSGRACTWLRA